MQPSTQKYITESQLQTGQTNNHCSIGDKNLLI